MQEPQLIESEHLTNLYDVVLLDEAQDYWPEEIVVFHKLSRVMFAVADSRQKIYKGGDGVATLRGVVDEVQELRLHYRNGLQICRFADAIANVSSNYEPLLKTARYDEALQPSSVNILECNGIANEAAEIIKRLEVQLQAYPNELIGVVTPVNDDAQVIWDEIKRSSLRKHVVLQSGDKKTAFDESKPIWVSSIHAFKGLEARAVHIAGLPNLDKYDRPRNVMYTAATRAKTALSLYASGSTPDFVRQAATSLTPATRLLNRADAFGEDI